MPAPVSFLSDFGRSDEFVGVVHGVIARISPEVRVIDVGHDFPRGDVKVAALALVPAVFVAWADGKVTPQERQSVMSAALHRGFEREPSAFYLVEAWLGHRPPDSLWDLWKEYAQALYASMPPEMATVLAHEILRTARAVAESSRKTLATSAICKEEQQILDEVESLSK